MPMGVPGWPDSAFWMASMHRVRIVLTQSRSRSRGSLWVMSSPPGPVLRGGRPAVAPEARAGDELGSEPDAPQAACPGQPRQTVTSQDGNHHGEMLAVRAT